MIDPPTPLPAAPGRAAAPPLDTERLTLRGHAVADFDDSLALWSDAAVTRHIGRPAAAEEVWARLLRYAGLWPLLGFGYWVVRERASGRFVGEVGIADFRRDVSPPLGGSPEAGWVLATWAHGRGFASEAVAAVLAWADAHVASRRTVCIIAPENAASLRVAAKAGFREVGRATYRDAETLVLERVTGAGLPG